MQERPLGYTGIGEVPCWCPVVGPGVSTVPEPPGGWDGAPHPGTDPPLWAAPGGRGTHKAPVVGLAEIPEEGRKSRAPGQGGGCHPGGLGHCQCPLSYPSEVVGTPSGVLLAQAVQRSPPCLGLCAPSPSSSPSLSKATRHRHPRPAWPEPGPRAVPAGHRARNTMTSEASGVTGGAGPWVGFTPSGQE